MTREQLNAIRARVEAATPGPWEAGTAFCCPDMGWIDGPKRMVCPVYEGAKRTHTLDANDAEFVASAREDVPVLLAEVEGMRESCTGLVKQNERQYDEVLRLTAERDTAFARGVEAMREALLQRFDWHGDVADRIRAEPVPEDKP